MFEDGCGLIGSSVNGWPSHWYFKQCAAEGQSDGNTAVFGFGAKYIVLEDCVAYGKGRYKYLFYDYDQNGTVFNDVCRRCFARMDWDGCRGSCPMDSFCSYAPTNMAFLNCIDIDGNTPTDWTSDEVAGSFAEQHLDLSNQNLLFQGCIAINTGQPLAFTQHSGESGVSFVDVVGVHLGGGFFGGGASFLRTTLLDVTSANFTYSSTGVSDMTSANTGFEYYSNGSPAQTLNNCIIRGNAGNAASGGWTGDYIDYYSAGKLSWSPTHAYTTDPYATDANGKVAILYPVRTEAGSVLNGLGVGANITQILGADGLEYGATGWNTPGGSLWPWPLEQWVVAQLASMDATIAGSTMPSPTRGVCGYSGKDGVHNTLTSYIWEFLGNQIPSNIYSSSSSPPPPVSRPYIVPTQQ